MQFLIFLGILTSSLTMWHILCSLPSSNVRHVTNLMLLLTVSEFTKENLPVTMPLVLGDAPNSCSYVNGIAEADAY